MAKNRFAATPVFLILCASCLFADTPIVASQTLSAPQAAPSAQPARQVSESGAITIDPGDVLSVQVFDTPELSVDSARVNPQGQISVPVLGIVEIGGLTATDAARRIESMLRDRGLLQDPHVIVSLVEYSSQGATVLGQIRAPGVFPTRGDRRLLDMIALAGGLDPSAGKIVTIAHRSDPHHPVVIELVPNALGLGAQENPVILAGDTVMVGRAGVVYILGDVNRPGGYLVDNNEHISLMQALTLAGGWDKTAGLSKARLIRKVPEGHQELLLDLKHVLNGQQADTLVQDGDILYVPSSFGKTLGYRGMEAAIAAAQTAVVYTGNY
jgi:polysaccharide export outer membrane protein